MMVAPPEPRDVWQTVPVIGVGGSHSRADAVAQWLHHVCRHVIPAVISGGHFLPEEQPTAITNLILNHNQAVRTTT